MVVRCLQTRTLRHQRRPHVLLSTSAFSFVWARAHLPSHRIHERLAGRRSRQRRLHFRGLLVPWKNSIARFPGTCARGRCSPRRHARFLKMAGGDRPRCRWRYDCPGGPERRRALFPQRDIDLWSAARRKWGRSGRGLLGASGTSSSVVAGWSSHTLCNLGGLGERRFQTAYFIL